MEFKELSAYMVGFIQYSHIQKLGISLFGIMKPEVMFQKLMMMGIIIVAVSAFGVSIATNMPKNVMLAAYSKKMNQYSKKTFADVVATPAIEKQIAQNMRVDIHRYGISARVQEKLYNSREYILDARSL